MGESAGSRARPIGAFALLAFGINGIVGVGIFFAPSQVARSVPGSAGVLVYLLTAAALLPIAWTYAALGGRFSVDGGPYVWAKAAFGSTVAFFVGWMTYVSALFSSAAVLTGLGQHAAPAIGIDEPSVQRFFTLCCVLSLAAVAASGLKPSALAWSGVTVLKLVPLAALVALGALGPEPVPSSALTLDGVERASLIVVFSCQGFEIVPVVAGSVRRSSRWVPLATVGSLAMVAVLYAILHFVCVSAVPALAESRTPLVDAARVVGGSGIARMVSWGANVSAVGIAFGMIVLTPRYLSVLAEREAFGQWIGAEDARRVPQRALWVTVAGVFVLVAAGELGQLFVLSSIAVLSQYAVTVLALATLASRRRHGFSARYLWPVPLALLGLVVAARGAETGELGVALVALAFGGALLFIRRRLKHASDGKVNRKG